MAVYSSTPPKNFWFLAPFLIVAAVVCYIGSRPSTFYSNYSFLKALSNSSINCGKVIATSNYSQSCVDSGLSPRPLDRSKEEDERQNATAYSSRLRTTNRSNLERLEADLAQARLAIKETSKGNQTQDQDLDYVPNGLTYWNPKVFQRSYSEMEKRLKVYIYEEGEPPLFHFGPCKHTYSIEGIFIQNMEVSGFRTFDPNEANLFFLPFSVTMLTQFVYIPDSHDWTLMKNAASDYINVIAQNHPYWNRSLGADHFMLACHDWGPEISFAHPNLAKNAIRALCNANTSEQFNPSRDVSIPEILLPGGTTNGLVGGPPPSKRPILVFYAGGVHGPIRPILLQHWENKSDPDVQIYKYLPKNMSYYGMMRKRRYCICPSGYEVASPRMVEGLYMGCVPVLIKDSYTIPLSDVLNWETFAVIVPVKDIPKLKEILMRIALRKYVKMQSRGIQMRRHFMVNSPPKRYDVFHMILHSIWLRRLNVHLHDQNST